MPNQIVYRPPFRRRGQNWLVPSKNLRLLSLVGSGGIEIGDSAPTVFGHGPSVESDIVIEWDMDNDGDFSESIEDITSRVLSAETFTGRDWPSLLTGKAGPGKLRATLRNEDDRFNYFNGASPAAVPPFSLRTGRKVRVRVADAISPCPVQYGKDRFRRTEGALGDDETGKTYALPLAGTFVVEAERAVAEDEGTQHMAVIDTGATDYYVQVEVSVLGGPAPLNRAGVVYRYVDSNDYSLCIIDAADASFQLVDIMAGVPSAIAAQSVEVYSGVTIGVLVSGSNVTGYLEGVPLLTGTAPNPSAELAGFYADWVTTDARPEIDEFYVWDGLTTTTEGVLWTGDVAELTTSVSAGPQKAAMLDAEGWLSKLSAQEITPPASINGRRTGFLVGNALSKALLLHPPGRIDLGDVTTGTFAISPTSALSVSRDVEETEFGFLYETQEGPLSFRSRSHRDSAVSQVTFSDAPGAQFGYTAIEPYDAKKEVFNRVSAGVSPWTEGEDGTLYTDPGPYILTTGQSTGLVASYPEGTVVRWTGHTRDITAPGGNPDGISDSSDSQLNESFTINLPGSITAGDLLLVIVGLLPESDSASWDGDVPPEWTLLASSNIYSYGGDIVLAKVAEGDEDSTFITLTISAEPCAWVAHIYQISDWHGSLDGVRITGWTGSSGTQPNPPSITPPWGPLPTLYIPYYVIPYDRSQLSGPTGYTNDIFTEQTASAIADVGIGSAERIASVTTENPGPFTLSSSVNQWRARTIAIQGPVATTTVSEATPSGSSPAFTIGYSAVVGGGTQSHENIVVTGIPLVQGAQTFAQVDDYTSQDEHNAIRTYQNSANLFATPAEAETYANLVLARYADDRPIFSLSFVASKSGAYRAQALRRRVGDKITLIANHNTGFGVSQDFFIESVSHKFSNGTKLWECTWELSPA